MPDAPKSQCLEIPGAWWPLGDPTNPEFGKLKIESTGDAVLTLEGVKPGALGRAFTKRSKENATGPSAQTFQGLDQHGKQVTLFGCVHENEQATSMYSKSIFGTALVLRGCHCASVNDIKFSRVKIEFAHLQEWLENMRPNLRDNGVGGFIVDFPDSTERLSPSGAGFVVGLQTLREQAFGEGGLRFNCSDHLTLHFDKQWDFEAIRKLIIDFQWFLTLAVSDPVSVTSMSGYTTVQSADGPPEKPIEIYTLWPGRRTAAPKTHGAEMMFTLRSLADGIGPTLARWRNYREKHGAVLTSYFATIFNEHLYQNHILLFLAHALELYHQINFDGAYQQADEFHSRIDKIVAAVPAEAEWLRGRLASANRKTFADRLRELVTAKARFAQRLIPDTELFVKKVRDTRNYYTHYDPSLLASGRIAQERELSDILVTMRVFLEAAVLDDLGLSAATERVLSRPRPFFVKLL